MDRRIYRFASARHTYSKVPEVSAWFWLVKALTTAMGESTSDCLVHLLVPEIAVVLGAIAFAVAIYIQFTKDRYIPWCYWFAVAMVGCVRDDVRRRRCTSGSASPTSSRRSSSRSPSRWCSVPGTGSRARSRSTASHPTPGGLLLGGGARDLCPRHRGRRPHRQQLGLGYFGSIWLFAAIIAIPAIGYFRFGMGSVLAFWFAYVVTRPLGASVADWLGKPEGVGLGSGGVSLIFAAAIVTIVWRLSQTGKDTPADQFGDPVGPAEGGPARVTP